MVTLAWTIVAVATILVLGWGLLAILVRQTGLFWHERWAAAWVLGIGGAAFAWFVVSPLYTWVSPIWCITAIAGATGLPAVARSAKAGARSLQPARGAKPPSASERGWGPASTKRSAADLALVAVLLVQIAVLVAAAVHVPLGWDGLFNFELKARLAFEHTPAGQLPLAYFSDVTRAWSHPHYPLVVPFAEFWVYAWVGRIDQSAAKILFPIFYLSLMGFVAGAVRRVANLRAAWLSAIGLGLLPPLTVQPGAISGYADVPLAAAFAGAACFAFAALRTAKPGAAMLSAALSAVAVWTKLEGLILAGVIGLVGVAAASWMQRREPPGISWRAASVLLWMPLVAAAPWLVFQHFYGQTHRGDFVSVSLPVLIENAGRLPAIIELVARELIRPGHWALVWPVFFVAVVLMAMSRRATAADGFLAGIVMIPLAVYGAVFVFSAWPDVREHIGISLPRLLVPLAPMALVFVVCRVHERVEAGEWG